MSAVEQLVICASLHNKLKMSSLCRELITKTDERKYVTQKAAQQLVQKFNFEGSFFKDVVLSIIGNTSLLQASSFLMQLAASTRYRIEVQRGAPLEFGAFYHKK